MWMTVTTSDIRVTFCVFLQLQRGADYLCPVQPDQHGWMYSRRGGISFNMEKMIFPKSTIRKKIIARRTPTPMVGLCLPQARPSQTSKALARWKKISFAIFYKLEIHPLSIYLVIINSFADLQAGPGQQCVHLPWCQSGSHCGRSGYLAYSADLTWVDNFGSVDHFHFPG